MAKEHTSDIQMSKYNNMISQVYTHLILIKMGISMNKEVEFPIEKQYEDDLAYCFPHHDRNDASIY